MTEITFDELSISEEIKSAIRDMGFTKPSPIQEQAIPLILEGSDIIGQAQTGTGKTAAFGIPLIDKIDPENKDVQSLILCPTRELAVQVSEEIKKLSKYKRGVHVVAIYGGESIDRQIKALRRGVQIIVGTPGRVMDHMERGTLDFKDVKMVVLDEADEMLDMGFREDIESILSDMPDDKQTIFFSATMSKSIMALTKQFQNHPKIVKVTKNELTVSTIEQIYFEVKTKYKIEAMSRLIDMHNLKLMLVFCNTKKRVDEVVEELQLKGYPAEGLHGDLRQMQRNSVMAKFRSGMVNILVATDVAARGIDVDNVEAVFNLDVPMDVEYYVHRIGRTGRAGKLGKAFTFVTGRNDLGTLRSIQDYTKVKIEKKALPSANEIFKFKISKFKDSVKNVLGQEKTDIFDTLLDDLVNEGFNMRDVAGALTKMHLGAPMSDIEDITLENQRDSRDQFDRRGRDRDRERGDRGSRGDSRGDRGDRGDRGRGDRNDRGERKEFNRGEKMVRLFINVGKNQKIRPGDIVGAISGETGINGSMIGGIDIFDKFSYVEVPKQEVDKVLEVMSNNTIKGKKISIEVAKP